MAAENVWPEIQNAHDRQRREMVLSGAEISARIERSGLDPTLFSLTKINFLEISKTCLTELPAELGQLTNISKLCLRENQLLALPSSLGNLQQLEYVDAAFNQLEALPEELGSLKKLQVLAVGSNRLTALPRDLSGLACLSVLDVSRNELGELPAQLCVASLGRLAEIRARANRIALVPHAISVLPVLKTLDLSDNRLTAVPGELGDCARLKDLDLKGNPIAERKLAKVVANSHSKQVIEFVRLNAPRKPAAESSSAAKKSGGGGPKGKARDKRRNAGGSDDKEITDQIVVLHLKDSEVKVIATEAVKSVRPHILCCIVRDVHLGIKNRLKKFITIQTRLHENECKKRTAATIATHDLGRLGDRLLYDARKPETMMMKPLMRTKDVSASELFAQLKDEADAARKEKKRNTYSGIHKYLYLLEDKELFPCLISGEDRVVSFPPITNSDLSKITADTKDIFVEVTSSSSMGTCKEVMEALLKEMLQLDLGSANADRREDDDDAEDAVRKTEKVLSVQQVKVVTPDGQLRVVYPSHADLKLDGILVSHSE